MQARSSYRMIGNRKSAPALVAHLRAISTPMMRWVDTDGRPLYESKSPRELWPPAMKMVTCRYADSRSASGLPMNVSALAAITAKLPIILDLVVAIRTHLVHGEPDAPLSLLELGQLVETSWNLPYYRYFISTANGGAPPELAPVIASLFKLAVGLGAVLRPITSAIVRSGHGAHSSITTEVLLTHIATSNALVGEHEVCAAPLELISEIVRAALLGERTPRPGVLEELAPDLDAAFEFARVQHDLMYWLRARGTQLRALSLSSDLPWWTDLPDAAGEAAVEWDGRDRAAPLDDAAMLIRDGNRRVAAAERALGALLGR